MTDAEAVATTCILTPDEVAAAKARADAASPGPWRTVGNTLYIRASGPPYYEGVDWFAFLGNSETAAFIAVARTDVPALAESHEALRADRDEWRRKALAVSSERADASLPALVCIVAAFCAVLVLGMVRSCDEPRAQVVRAASVSPSAGIPEAVAVSVQAAEPTVCLDVPDACANARGCCLVRSGDLRALGCRWVRECGR